MYGFQEAMPDSQLLPTIMHTMMPGQTIGLNPTQYTPNGFVRVSLDGQAPMAFSHRLYNPNSQTNLLYPAQEQLVRNNAISPSYTFVDPFGQRIVDRPEFIIGPTRSPLMSQPARYDVVPQLIYSTTQGYGTKLENQGHPTFITVHNGAAQQGPFLKLQTIKTRPNQYAISSEQIKFVNYHNPSFGDGGNVRNRPSLWPQTRNLPKRGSNEYSIQHPTSLRLESRDIDISDDGTLEILKLNDTESISFSPLLKQTDTQPSGVLNFTF